MVALGFELLFRLLWGFALSVIFVRRTESSEKFVKIAARFVSGAVLIAIFLNSQGSGTHARSLGLLMCFAGFYLYALIYARWGRLLGFALLFIGPFVAFGAEGPRAMFNFVSSALLLGGFFGGQFLGHWFLNVPGMHIRELKRIMIFLFVGLGAKSLEVVWTLTQRLLVERRPLIDAMGRPLGEDIGGTDFLLSLNPSNSLFSLEGDLWLGLGSYGLILVSMRLIWGILAGWVLALMVRQTVQSRSTQSATGVLYAACVMVLVGEAVALYVRDVLKLFL